MGWLAGCMVSGWLDEVERSAACRVPHAHPCHLPAAPGALLLPRHLLGLWRRRPVLVLCLRRLLDWVRLQGWRGGDARQADGCLSACHAAPRHAPESSRARISRPRRTQTSGAGGGAPARRGSVGAAAPVACSHLSRGGANGRLVCHLLGRHAGTSPGDPRGGGSSRRAARGARRRRRGGGGRGRCSCGARCPGHGAALLSRLPLRLPTAVAAAVLRVRRAACWLAGSCCWRAGLPCCADPRSRPCLRPHVSPQASPQRDLPHVPGLHPPARALPPALARRPRRRAAGRRRRRRAGRRGGRATGWRRRGWRGHPWAAGAGARAAG